MKKILFISVVALIIYSCKNEAQALLEMRISDSLAATGTDTTIIKWEANSKYMKKTKAIRDSLKEQAKLDSLWKAAGKVK